MPVLRLGPPEIRDPQRRSLATHVERVRFTGIEWSAPGRILYVPGLCAGEPQGFSMELEVREAIQFYNQLGATLRASGLIS